MEDHIHAYYYEQEPRQVMGDNPLKMPAYVQWQPKRLSLRQVRRLTMVVTVCMSVSAYTKWN